MLESRDTYEARIYTPTYRAYGVVYLPPNTSTEALLNSVSRSLLPVTEPLIYTPGYNHPPGQDQLKVSAGFMAVHYDQISWMVGGRPPERPSESDARRLALLYDGYILVGRIRVAEGTRSSDFLEVATSFQTLFDTELYPWRAPEGRFLLLGRGGGSLFEVGAAKGDDSGVVMLESAERFDFVTVNLKRVTGVLEAPQNEAAANPKGVLN